MIIDMYIYIFATISLSLYIYINIYIFSIIGSIYDHKSRNNSETVCVTKSDKIPMQMQTFFVDIFAGQRQTLLFSATMPKKIQAPTAQLFW